MTLRASLIIDGTAEGAKRAAAETARELRTLDKSAASASRGLTTATTASRAMTTGTQLSAQQVQNLSFQVNDLAQQLATGVSPLTAFLQQGSQIVQVFGTGTGVGAALRATGSAMAQFLLNPLTLATVGFGLTAQAAVSFFGSVFDGASDSEAALERHEQLISDIKDAYGLAANEAKTFVSESKNVIKFQAQQNAERLADQLQRQTQELLRSFQTFDIESETGATILAERYREIAGEILDLQRTLDEGEPDVQAFRRGLVDLANTKPELAELVNELLAATDEAGRTARALEAVNKAIEAGKKKDELPASAGGKALFSDFDRRARNAADRVTSFERLIRGTERQTEALRLQAEVFGLTAAAAARLTVETELLAAAKARGITLTEAETVRIRELATAQSEAVADLEQLRQAEESQRRELEALRAVGETAFGAIGDAIEELARTGKVNVKDLVSSTLADLARLAQNQLMQQLLGNLVGGGTTGGSNAGSLFGGGTTGGSTLESLFGGGTTGGFSLSSLFGGFSLPGFATGGDIEIGGRPGVDTNVLSINSRPLVRVSQGETLSVRPRSASGAGDGAGGINFAPVFSSDISPQGRAWVLGQIRLSEARMARLVDGGRGEELKRRSDAFTRVPA